MRIIQIRPGYFKAVAVSPNVKMRGGESGSSIQLLDNNGQPTGKVVAVTSATTSLTRDGTNAPISRFVMPTNLNRLP